MADNSLFERKPASIESVFEDLRQSIEIVKNDLGQVYWPQWSVNTIGNMIPGSAYQIKLNQQESFTYSANAIEMPLDQRLGNIQPKFFSINHITESNMTLGIPIDAWDVRPNLMDEIAVCDMHDRIVGSGVFLEDDLVLTIWENDEYVDHKIGLNEGETFKLKIRDMQSQTTYSLNINSWLKGNNYYEKDEISIISEIDYGEPIDQDFYVYNVIPNPASNYANIQIYSTGFEKVSIEVFNVLGTLVYNETFEVNEGINNFNLPVSEFSMGTYQIKVQTSDNVSVQLIQIID